MKICVCVKQVEETYARTGKNPEQHFLDPMDRIFRINPYDEAAMVLASRAAASLKNARIVVLTIGQILAEDELWRIMGMGGDKLYHIEMTRPDNGSTSLDSWSKAQVLANAVNTVGGDLVLCGKESIDRQNGLVANFLAHHLKRPFVSSILNLRLKDDTVEARVTKSAGKGVREIVDCRLPAVFSVDLFPGAFSIPSYEAKQKARQQTVTQMLFDSRTMNTKTHRVEIAAPRPRPKPVPVPDSSLPSFDRVRQLLTGSSIQKKGKMVFGSPETQVEEILQFLGDHNIISTADKEKPPV